MSTLFETYAIQLDVYPHDTQNIIDRILTRYYGLYDTVSDSITDVQYMDVRNISNMITEFSTSNNCYFVTGKKVFKDARSRFGCIYRSFVAIVIAQSELELFGILFGTHDLPSRFMEYKQSGQTMYTVQNVCEMQYDTSEIIFIRLGACHDEEDNYCSEHYCIEEISVV